MIRKAIKANVIFFLVFAFIFSAYSDANAQKRTKRKKTAKPTVVKKVQSVSPNISFVVSMSKPWTHLLEVQMRVDWAQMPEKAEIKMPVWTPGSYLVREYARHVQDFVVVDAEGNSLNWRKANKNTWQIDTKGAKNIRVGYQVYANNLTVRTNELNDEHAFISPAALFMFPKGQLGAASIVNVRPYKNWKVATGLPKIDGVANTFRAKNYDILYDSPFEVSNFTEKKFMVRGKPHRYVVTGKGNYDLDKIAIDTTKIIEESYKIFGELPYDNYTFILNLRGGGGLEHLNSTALQFNARGFHGGTYTRFLGLVAHEYFHLWNVKRIRPDALGPFDYENENYTKLLWVAEGATSYYASVILQRAGLTPKNRVIRTAENIISGLQRRPGRFQTSLEEASQDAWIKAYRTDENAINNQISYYSKGQLVNFLIDVKIRVGSNGSKSLDDVMKHLNVEYSKKGKNFTPEDYQKICEMMAGGSLNDFFNKYVRGRDEIDYNSILNLMGLKISILTAESDKAYLGANLSTSNNRLTIRSLPVTSPAYKSGLNARDQIVAVDGHRASRQFLTSYLASKKAGDKITLAIFRFNKLRKMVITLGRTPASGYRIVPANNRTADQKRLYDQFIGKSLG